jgi:signal transduction histidine kinase
MRISQLIFLSFSFILLLFAVTTYINYRQSEKVRENAAYTSLSADIVRNANRFQRNVIHMVSGLRGFLITGENYFLQAYDSASAENFVLIRELSQVLPDTSYQKKLLNEIEGLNAEWINEFTAPLRAAKIKAGSSDKNLASYNQLYKEKMYVSPESKNNLSLQSKIRELINVEYEIREKRQQMLARSIQSTKNISFGLTIFSIIAGLFVVSFLAYRIQKRISTMVNMADTIASGNFEVHTSDHGKDELGRLGSSLNHMANILSGSFTELRRKNQELDQFAHIVSHDMKTPLRGIGNVVGWIEEDHKQELSPKMTEYLELVKERVQRGEHLIQGLLSYSRIGKEKFQNEQINIKSMLDSIVDNYNLNSHWKIFISPDLPVINSHSVPLFHIFSNLISNAIKYNDKPVAEISVYHREHPGHYEFFVRDNGPGISKNYHQKIFVIFQTLHETRSPESTGVGLAIVKKILDSRNEAIHLESTPGEGSIFSFTWKKNRNE